MSCFPMHTILHSEHLDPVIVHVSVNNKDVIVSSDSNTIRIIVVPRTSIMLSSIPEKELSKV